MTVAVGAVKQVDARSVSMPVESHAEVPDRHGRTAAARNVQVGYARTDLAGEWTAQVYVLADVMVEGKQQQLTITGTGPEYLAPWVAHLVARHHPEARPCARCGEPITDPENAPTDDSALCRACGDTDDDRDCGCQGTDVCAECANPGNYEAMEVAV